LFTWFLFLPFLLALLLRVCVCVALDVIAARDVVVVVVADRDAAFALRVAAVDVAFDGRLALEVVLADALKLKRTK
jgi:hypothetical protein